jgi:hypothetical protein
MTITLTSGATVQTLCDGLSHRGETGYLLGPIESFGLDWAWDLQMKKPLRATSAVPIHRGQRLLSFGFSVYRLFATEEAAFEYACYTLPATVLTSGTLSFVVGTGKHVDIANCALTGLATRLLGVEADIDFRFAGGATTYVEDPAP